MKSLMMKSSQLKLLTILAVVCLCSALVLAESSNEQPEPKKILTDLEQRMQKRVCVDVNEVPIGTVLRQLAMQVDVDLIKSPNVSGTVTVTLTDVSLEEALRSILDVHGCGYIAGENIIRIFSREEMPEISERLITETFEIIYADVTQVVAALDKFKSAQGSVSSIQGTSHIIVTDTESKVRDIGNLLKKIDRITPQVLVEVKIYDITSRNNFDLGIEWNASRRTNLGIDSSLMNDDIIAEKGGIDTYYGSRTDPAIIAGFEGATNKTDDTTIGFFRLGWLNESVDIDAQLRAEQEDIDAKLLANPRLLVIDNETALFDIVTEHPYIERTITGGTVIETVKFKDVGVKLEVTPHVAREDIIRLNISPEFSVVMDRVQIVSSNVPIVNTRKVTTIALVKDNQTVVLGGLREKDTVQRTNKIPVLGDLPVLGNLFKFEGEQTIITELVVFITPRIIIEPVLTQDELQALEVTEFSGPKPTPTKAEEAKTTEE
ncbi:MAG: type II secretion system protein GspD [Planctomycetota bacterium]|jgi:type IV pilus assembly protein PilQ